MAAFIVNVLNDSLRIKEGAIDQFFVVTGGPGAGKTSLVAALAARGLVCVAESARVIIRDQVASGGPALPWADREAFAQLMLGFDLRAWKAADATAGPTIFDRGIPDIVGYRRLVGLPIPADLDAAARQYRYNRIAFAARPWRDIFASDAERKQTFVEAELTYEAVCAAYTVYGYDLEILPRVPIDARVAFVLDAITRVAQPSRAGDARAAAPSDANDGPGSRADRA